MTDKAMCAGESINLAAAAAAGIVVETFDRRQISVILIFLSLLIDCIGALLLADRLISNPTGTSTATPDIEVSSVI